MKVNIHPLNEPTLSFDVEGTNLKDMIEVGIKNIVDGTVMVTSRNTILTIMRNVDGNILYSIEVDGKAKTVLVNNINDIKPIKL